jgi:hypothetical protein
LSGADADVERRVRSAIRAKNPAPIEIEPTRRGYSWPGVERRDLLKTTSTMALPVSVYDRIFMHLVESSAVMRAGATVVITAPARTCRYPSRPRSQRLRSPLRPR